MGAHKKYRKPLCPKCNDQGFQLTYERVKGKIAGYRRVPCRKNCAASERYRTGEV